MLNENFSRLMLDAANYSYTNGNHGDIRDYRYLTEIENPNNGLHVTLFRNEVTNEVIVAFTGTENFQDAFSDLNLGWDQWVSRKEALFNILRGLAGTLGLGTVHFTGHSLGGVLAQYAAYDYVLAKTNSNDPIYDPFFSIDQISLTTFNALGGVEGIHKNLGAYNSNIMAGLEGAHYRVRGDLVSRLGSGHVGGNVYELAYGTPPFSGFDPYQAHRIGTFYAYRDAVPFSGAQLAVPAYLALSDSQAIAARFGNLFNGSEYSDFESKLRLIGGVLIALKEAPAEEVGVLIGALSAAHKDRAVRHAFVNGRHL